MTDDTTPNRENTPAHKRSHAPAGLIIPEGQQSPYRYGENDIGLAELWAILWRRKWIMILATVVFAILSVAYALKATEWFRADVLLAPTERETGSTLAGQIGGLAGLAGIDVSSGTNVEPSAVLRSREFAREFISDLNLMPILFAEQYDSATKAWIDPDPASHPEMRDAVKLFRQRILKISTADDGMVTLAVEWTDPNLAADWAMLLVKRLNHRLRQQALQEAEANIEYLQSELAKARLVTIQQSIGRLMESELQKVMMARGRQEFSFRVIDPAVPPKERSHPRRALVAVMGTALGGVLGFFAALFLGLRQRYRAARIESAQPR